jgi:hypothetical protein
MKKSIKLICVFLALGVLIAYCAVITSVSANKNQYKTDMLIFLEQEKERLEKNNEEVPEDLLRKIEFEKEYSKEEERNREKLAKEEIEKSKKPIVQEWKPSEEKNPRPPHPDAGFIGGKGTGQSYFPQEYRLYNFTGMVIAPYNTLIAATYKEDNNKAFIRNIKFYPDDDMKIDYLDTEFEGKGEITFTGLTEDNKIVMFIYEDGKEGYFDLENNRAVFEKFK